MGRFRLEAGCSIRQRQRPLRIDGHEVSAAEVATLGSLQRRIRGRPAFGGWSGPVAHSLQSFLPNLPNSPG
jgi:hypothetical protein